MKNRHFLEFAVVACLLCLPFCRIDSARAQSTLLESHFGVELSVGQATDYCPILGGDYTRYVFENEWDPTPATADHTVEDYTAYWSDTDFDVCDSTVISGGEPYDVEALYFDDDVQNLYISIVTSFDPPAGRIDTRVGGGVLVVSGDVGLNLGLNGAASGVDPFNYDYAVNVNNEVRQSSGNAQANASPAVGGSIYRTSNSDWYTGTPSNDADTPRDELTNFDPEYQGGRGTDTGEDAIVAYTRIDFDQGALENNYETYVIDLTIPRSALPPLYSGDEVEFQYVMGCRNDGGSESGVVRLSGIVDIPEPATALLVLLAGCAALRRRPPRS